MTKQSSHSHSALWRIYLAALLILVLASSSPSGLRAGATDQVHAQAALLQRAAAHPNTLFGVIVQKATAGKQVEEAAQRLGGKVTQDLSIINGFSAQMPGKAITELAKLDGVRWISADGKMQEMSGPTTFTTWATDFGSTPASQKAASFNGTAIRSGSYIWFSSTIKPSGINGQLVKFFADESTVQFTVNGSTYTVNVPGAVVTYDPAATTATTAFDADTNSWLTTVPASYGGNTFLTAVPFGAPDNLPGSVQNVTWSISLSTDTTGLGNTNWQWAAAVYSNIASDLGGINVKPVDNNSTSQYANGDKAGSPENYKPYVIAGARGNGGNDFVGGYSGMTASVTPLFNNAPNMVDSVLGPDGTYGYGSTTRAYFSGFYAETTPGNAITRVEIALVAYVPAILNNHDDPVLTVSLNGVPGSSIYLNHHAFDAFVGQSNVTTIYVDVTGTRAWHWSDFDGDLQVSINQSGFNNADHVYYDAVGLRVTSDTGTDASAGATPTPLPKGAIDTSRLLDAFDYAVRAPSVWNEAPALLQGDGIGVAVVDSGVYKTKDLDGRIVSNQNFNHGYHTYSDGYGHGTFVAGLIAGNGRYSNGAYMGVAPKADVINVRVSDDNGMSIESDVVAGLQWILNNKTKYNIRVVNMSLNASTTESYHTSALDAACEVLWFNGIVVVVSAGNNGLAGGPSMLPPANDPFVITVGATNDLNSPGIFDDSIAPFSSYGLDETGGIKPDIVAPGAHLVSLLPHHQNLTISRDHANNRVNINYFRMSGTSMSAPIVAGAVALLLQDEPSLTPDQVKYRLKATAVHDSHWPAYDPTKAGAGYLDIYAAVHGTTTQSANTGLQASQLLWTGDQPITWGSVNWNSVNWNSVNWNSVNWNSVNWNSVNWNSDDWNP